MAFFLQCLVTTTVVPTVGDFLYESKTGIKIGMFVAANSIAVVIFSPLVSCLLDVIGFEIPLLGGFFIFTSASLVSAFANRMTNTLTQRYCVILAARFVLGIGEACSVVSSLAMVAVRFPDPMERSIAVGRVLLGFGVGSVVGFPFGGAFASVPGGIEEGWKYPFIAIAAMAAGTSVLCLMSRGTTEWRPGVLGGTSTKTLITDPLIAIGLWGLILMSMSLAVIEPILPLWMETEFKDPPISSTHVGLVMLAVAVMYVIIIQVFGRTSIRNWWIVLMLGQMVVAFSLAMLPLTALFKSNNVYYSIFPLGVLGVGTGMMDAVLLPLLSFVVDQQHNAAYGKVYSLATISFSVGFVVGPIYSSTVARYVNFNWATWSMAIIMFCMSFLMLYVRNVRRLISVAEKKEEEDRLVLRYSDASEDQTTGNDSGKVKC